MHSISIQDALRHAEAAGLPRLDAQMLLLHVLARDPADRAWLIAHQTEALDAPWHARFAALCERRLSDEPLAYLTGQRAFHGLVLAVDARVLDPRPDTETLVDWALDLPLPPHARVLDLGTGSGAVALALKAQRLGWQVWAGDASSQALDVARSNANRLALTVDMRQGDWFAPFEGMRFDLVVSNPPYIAEGDPHLAALQHEPQQALVSGPQGLDAIGHIAGHAHKYLAPGGWLLLEHGWDQQLAVCGLLAQAGFARPATRKDLAGVGRCSGAIWPTRG